MKCWKIEARLFRIPFIAAGLMVILVLISGANISVFAQDDNPDPPDEVVKLIFIHHSTGENWLRDGYGELGKTLGENNYFVSDTNYGWGPNSIGDRTDITDWPEWFRSRKSEHYMEALFDENGQLSSYTRTLADPGEGNQVVMFKSCFPNSNLSGNPDDPPKRGRGLTVSNAKYIYNDLLSYFLTRPDKLFVVITAPPLQHPEQPENARAFNTWLVEDWLVENNYPLDNVAVFDFYNVLTHPDNHHRFKDGQIEHISAHGSNTLFYDSHGDDHPNPEGSQKASEEFVSLLNYYYQRWQAGDPPAEAPPAPAQPGESGGGLPCPGVPALVISIVVGAYWGNRRKSVL